MEQRFESFEEFWPYYVMAHSKKGTRTMHLLGTSAGLAAAVTGVLTGRWWLLAAAPVLGYGPAWIGHFFIEGNMPATFGHPLWSLRGDFVMLGKMLAGTMDAEVERARRDTTEGNGQGERHNGESSTFHVEVDTPDTVN